MLGMWRHALIFVFDFFFKECYGEGRSESYCNNKEHVVIACNQPSVYSSQARTYTHTGTFCTQTHEYIDTSIHRHEQSHALVLRTDTRTRWHVTRKDKMEGGLTGLSTHSMENDFVLDALRFSTVKKANTNMGFHFKTYSASFEFHFYVHVYRKTSIIY